MSGNSSPQTEALQNKKEAEDSVAFAPKEEITENNCRFKVGEPLRFVRVRFPGHARSYPFLVGKRKLIYGQKVMAMSDRGMAVGYINSFIYELPYDKSMLPLRSINKVASEEDIQSEQETYQKQKFTETLCQKLIDKHNLDMNLTHVEFTQFGKKVVFYFVAPARVDFRALVRDLVGELKLRIELRQISVRDRSASMGALGPCGRELCCSSFLSRYGNVSIKMAKNQNLTLNYSKLNGVCGQLKCCLQYEDEVYHHKRKTLPDEGSFAETTNGDKGKIFRLHILNEQFDLLTEQGKIKRYTQNYFKKRLKAEDVKMPGRFDNISDETSTVLGLNEVEQQKSLQFEKDMLELKTHAGTYASETFEGLTGVAVQDQTTTPQQKEAAREREMLAKEGVPALASPVLSPGEDPFNPPLEESGTVEKVPPSQVERSASPSRDNRPETEGKPKRGSRRGGRRNPRGKSKPKS